MFRLLILALTACAAHAQAAMGVLTIEGVPQTVSVGTRFSVAVWGEFDGDVQAGGLTLSVSDPDKLDLIAGPDAVVFSDVWDAVNEWEDALPDAVLAQFAATAPPGPGRILLLEYRFVAEAATNPDEPVLLVLSEFLSRPFTDGAEVPIQMNPVILPGSVQIVPEAATAGSLLAGVAALFLFLLLKRATAARAPTRARES
jgi:hypothetical protein